MYVIRVAVVAAVPTSLHTDLIRVIDLDMLRTQRALDPDVCRVTVGLLSERIVDIDVEDMPLWVIRTHGAAYNADYLL